MTRPSIAVLTLGLILTSSALARPPVVAGLAREGADHRTRGLILLGELGCTSCHTAGPWETLIAPKEAPDLRGIGARARADFLQTWLADPQGVKPGTTMPDVLVQLASREEREAAARALTHYIISVSEERFPVAQPESTAAHAAKGRELYHSVGCVACHSPRDASGDEISPGDSVPLGRVSEKYSIESLATFLEDPLRARPSGRMPGLHLTPNEAFWIACYLVGSGDATKPRERFELQEAEAKRGEKLFAELGCGSCHNGLQDRATQGATELADVDPHEGCLSGRPGAWPLYPLSQRQRADIRAALAVERREVTDEEQIRKTLVTFNCIACHARGDLGGIPEDRNEYYLTTDGNLGETGRIPPPLTGVGAKLKPEWLRKTLVSGQAIRPYMTMRMPAFGRGNVEHLAELFARRDSVPEVTFPPLPEDRKKARAVRDMGHRLVGDKGLSCITCHTFRGRQSGAMGAVDLIETTAERLRKDWFYHYMLNPPRFRSITIMPQFFPDGTSTLKDVAGGDPKTQLDAIWRYFEEGRNTRAPSGLRRPPMELVVQDEAVMLRRSAQDTGKRAISVGYPAGVHLTFDAESVSLNQVWRGKFLDPVAVWTGQGSGRARVLSRDRILLGKGPAFANLAHSQAAWPSETSRELGIRFKGYELDEKRRPTFRYSVGQITVTDRPLDVSTPASGEAFLARTLALESDEPLESLYFRIAVHRRIEMVAPGVAHLGERLRIAARAGGDVPEALELTVREVDKERELIARVPHGPGLSTLTLEYRWLEAEE